MAIRRRLSQPVGYGLGDPLIALAPLPIIAQRAPNTSDFAELGTVWVDEPNNDSYVLCSITANSANWVSAGGGSGSFNTLTVTNTITSTNGDIISGGTVEAFGNIETSDGNILSGNDIDAVANITATNGDISATAGNIFTAAPGSQIRTDAFLTLDVSGLGAQTMQISGQRIDAGGSDTDVDIILAPRGNASVSIELPALSALAGLEINQASQVALLQVGTGTPVHSAPKGSLYINTAGSTVDDRAYINTNGTTGWTAVITDS
jgi:hypothetical protein